MRKHTNLVETKLLDDDDVYANVEEGHDYGGQDNGHKIEEHEKVVVHDWYKEAFVTSQVAIVPAEER